jgi:FkbM family methyltransferase
MRISQPSILLKLLSYLVKTKKLKRGYGWLLTKTPSLIWGGENIETKTDVGKITLPLQDPGSIGILLFGCIQHEVQESAFIRKMVSKFDVCIDIGAHIGWYSVLMWQSMEYGNTVFAFEPNSIIFPYLQRNVDSKNGIKTFPQAVSDKSGKAMYYRSPSSNLGSTLRHVGTSYEVDCISLDDFSLAHNVFGKIDFIKCDVEGGEYNVFQGACKVMSANNPPIWMFELDRAFLGEADISIDNLIYILNKTGAHHFFYLNENRLPVEIYDLHEVINSVNIFIVPSARLSQFQKIF